MLNPLKLLRYLVFVVFVICNAIIASAAVWNLSIVQAIADDAVAKGISIYLIFLGALGLVVIFIVFFCDLYGKDIFICRVWFELLWVNLFFLMELAGAGAITTQSGDRICNSNFSGSPCVSTKLLQAFTWICAIMLLAYFFLLFTLAISKYRDDSAIWRYTIQNFFWHHTRRIVPGSSASLPSFRTQAPIIAAPRPRRIVPMPEAGLSYRSGLSLDYEIEHYQPTAPTTTDPGPVTDGPISPLPPTTSSTRTLSRSVQKPVPAAFAPFYPVHVQAAMNPGLQHPSTAHLSPVRKLPSPSPPPLGDWPRQDAVSQPLRVKRKRTQNSSTAPTPYSFTMSATAQQPQSLVTPSTRSRPSGPRRRSNSNTQWIPPA